MYPWSDLYWSFSGLFIHLKIIHICFDKNNVLVEELSINHLLFIILIYNAMRIFPFAHCNLIEFSFSNLVTRLPFLLFYRFDYFLGHVIVNPIIDPFFSLETTWFYFFEIERYHFTCSKFKYLNKTNIVEMNIMKWTERMSV